MSEWDALAATWDDQPGVRDYAEGAFSSLLEEVRRRGGTLRGTSALDYGCGPGLLTERLAEVCDRVDAVDASPAMLEVLDSKVAARGWKHVAVHRASPSDPAGRDGGGLPDGSWDLVVCSSVCSFLGDYPSTVAELLERLAPGGLFVQWDWERTSPGSDATGLTRAQIEEALVGTGLEDVRVARGFVIGHGEREMSPLMGSGSTGSGVDGRQQPHPGGSAG